MANLFAVEKVFEDLVALLVKLFLDEPFESFAWKASLLFTMFLVWILSMLLLAFSSASGTFTVGRGAVAHVFIFGIFVSLTVASFHIDDFIDGSFDVGAVNLVTLELLLGLHDCLWLDHLLICLSV